jgi:hypothetical protein
MANLLSEANCCTRAIVDEKSPFHLSTILMEGCNRQSIDVQRDYEAEKAAISETNGIRGSFLRILCGVSNRLGH